MILESIHIDRFGKWVGLRLNHLEEGVNLFYGSNETGKTTLMQFLRSMFYGFSAERLAYASETEPEKTGGDIVFSTSDGTFHLARHLAPNFTPPSDFQSEISNGFQSDFQSESVSSTNGKTRNEAFSAERSSPNRPELPFYAQDSFRVRFQTKQFEDGLVFTDEKGTRLDTFQLKALLSLSNSTSASTPPAKNPSWNDSAGNNLTWNSETLFNNIFAIGLLELQKLSVLDSTEASKQLYDLSTGIQRFSLQNILSNFQESRGAILKPTETLQFHEPSELEWQDEFFGFFFQNSGAATLRKTSLSTLFYFRDVLKKRLENVQLQQKRYMKIHTERTNLNERQKDLTKKIDEKRHEIRILEISESVRDPWNRRSILDSQIVDFSAENQELMEISDASIEELEKKRNELKTLRKSFWELREKRENLIQQLHELQEKYAAIPLNPLIMEKFPQIEVLLQQQSWIETLRGRLEDLLRIQMDTESQLTIDYRHLGLPLPDFTTSEPPEKLFPYDVRTLRKLRTPTREMYKIYTKIKTTQQKLTVLRNQGIELSQKISTYFHDCSTRFHHEKEVENMAELRGFPEIFRISEMDASRSRSRKESSIKALSTVNSQIVSEIPAEILDVRREKIRRNSEAHSVSQRSNNLKETTLNSNRISQMDSRSNSDVSSGLNSSLNSGSVLNADSGSSLNPSPEMNIEMESNVKMFLMDVNAASRLLGEVLAAQRRAEMNLQQLLQIVHNLDKIRTEIRNTKKGLILTPRDCVALGTAFTVGLTISIFETIRLSGWIVPESYFSSFFFFVLSSAVWISCAAGRFFFLKKLEQKLEKQSQNIENMERQRNRLIRICFPSREKEVLEFQNAETSELCTKEIQRIQKVIGILEKELQESESMGAIASKRSAILLESRQFKAHLHKLGKTYKESKARRAEVLKSLQLPETWNSSNIRQLLDASDRMRELWRRRSRDLEDFHLYSQELAVLVERLQMLLENFGEDFAKSQHTTDERFPFQADIFKNIRTKITEVQTASNQASEMKKKINVIQKNRKKIQTEIQKLSQERGRLLANSGVSDEKMLSQKLVKLGTLRNLRSQRRDLQKKMDAVIDFTCSESVLWNLYEKNSPEQIAEKKKVSLNVLSELEFQKEAVETRLKECSTILSTILTDDSPTRLQYELMETEARIGHCINRWRTYATAQRLMETIQKTYQQKRQPQTLERASIYVQEMTEKKYVRVWTPVDEDILYVEQADGTRFSAEQLSTGTRELLYLAIRLALIEEYRTEGVILPVVLDDVLVNFDHRRAAAAAKVLTRFAGQKTQILFFTSHEHIREIFEKENALICNMEKRTKD